MLLSRALGQMMADHCNVSRVRVYCRPEDRETARTTRTW